MSNLPIAFDVQAVRAAMLEGIVVPRDIVNSAFAELAEQIHAKDTKFFTYKGSIINKVDIADNGARLQAIDQTLSLAGLFRPDDRRGGGAGNNNVAIEVKDGVIRIAVGSPLSTINLPVPSDKLIEERPAAISISTKEGAGEQSKLADPNDAINRYNTILDEIVDD